MVPVGVRQSGFRWPFAGTPGSGPASYPSGTDNTLSARMHRIPRPPLQRKRNLQKVQGLLIGSLDLLGSVRYPPAAASARPPLSYRSPVAAAGSLTEKLARVLTSNNYVV